MLGEQSCQSVRDTVRFINRPRSRKNEAPQPSLSSIRARYQQKGNTGARDTLLPTDSRQTFTQKKLRRAMPSVPMV